MIKSKIWIFFLGLCLLHFQNGHAQSANETVEFSEVLPELEEHFNITFSYLNETIRGIQVKPWTTSEKLSSYLKYVNKQTNLEIHRLDERYYSISLKRKKSLRFCGYLQDFDTKTPLNGVIIINGNRNAISLEDGYFELVSDQSSQNLSFRHVGYQKLNLTQSSFTSDTCQIIFLRPSVSALDEVIVHNFIAQGIEKKLSGAYQLSRKQLQILPGVLDQDVMQSLQVLPGVYSAAESVSRINIRGGTNDQNLVLWEGIRMYQTGHFFGLISVFNPYFTQQVSLIKNGTSASHGESVSSLLDIRGATEQAEKSLVSGGFNLLNADLEMEIPLGEKTSIFLGGRHSVSDFLQTPAYDQFYDRAFGDVKSEQYLVSDTLNGEVKGFSYHDVNMKIIHRPKEKEQWNLSFLHLGDELSFREETTTSNTLTKSSQVSQYSTAGGLTYQRDWNERWSTHIESYVSHYRLQSENMDLVNDQLLSQENEVWDGQAKINAHYRVSDRVRWSGGYSFDEQGITNADEINNPAFQRRIKEVMRTHAIFSEGTLTFGEGETILSAGIRYNLFESLDRSTIEPRVLLNHRLSDQWSLELAGEQKSQTALQVIDLQNDFLGVEKRRWVLANDEDLPILRSQQISAGLIFADRNWQFTLESYLKEVDGIVTSSQSFQNQFEFIRSTGLYRVTGLDFLLNYQYLPWSLWTSYSVSRNMNKFEELLSQEFPSNIDIRHFITSGINYSSKKFEYSAGLNWHTGNPFTEPEQELPVLDGELNYQFPNSSKLPYYLRVDLAATFKFQLTEKINGRLGLSVWNITNQKNIVNAYYILLEDNTIQRIDENGLGLTPNLMFRMTF